MIFLRNMYDVYSHTKVMYYRNAYCRKRLMAPIKWSVAS